jgi:hypothetical protein
MKPLSPKQKTLARLLASGSSGVDACKEVGVTTVTLHRWKQLPEFKDYLAALITTFEQESLHRLYTLKFQAVERLATLLGHTNPSVALRAAECVLNRTQSSFEKVYQPIPMLQTAASWETVQRELERIAAESKQSQDAQTCGTQG